MSDTFDITKVLGAGRESIDRGVLGQPFIQIIQKGSPEFDETHKEHKEKKIDGCKPGNILFAPERKILTTPIKVIPLSIVTLYTEWKPRAQGGGFAGNKPLSIISDRAYRKGASNTPDQYKEWLGDNELKLTIYATVLFLLGTEWKRGIISFNATQLKPARIWQKQILNLRYDNMPDAEPPVFAAMWNFASAPDSNEKGGWYGWDISFDHMLDFTKEQKLLEESFAAQKLEIGKQQLALPPAEKENKDLPF